MQYKFVDNFIKKLQERDQNARLSSVYTGHQPRTPTQNNSRIENLFDTGGPNGANQNAGSDYDK